MPVKIVLADAEPNVRSALCLLLEHQPDIYITGVVDNSTDLLEDVQTQYPDVVFMDWHLRGEAAPAVLAVIHSVHPHARVIVLSGHPELRQMAFAAGADGFVSKGDPPEVLLSALRTVLSRG